MVRVPEYNPNVSARPAFRSELSPVATPEAFGAGVGRGMQQLAQGVSNLGASFQAVQELEDQNRAKDADNSYASWLRERMYGEGGFMTLEGRNAVDGRAAFEAEAEQKRMEFGKGLTGGAAKMYQNASTARVQSTLQQSIVHTANARKSWFKQASTDRMNSFANDALVNYNNPALVQKNMAAGLLELRQKGELEGWDADTLKLRELEYASGVHRNVTLRIAQDDPIAADAYMKKNAGQMTGADQYDLGKSLETAVKNEQSKRAAGDFFNNQRGSIGEEGVGVTRSRTVGQTGPSNARAFLQSKSNKDASHVDGLDEAFATNLAALIQDAPPEIRDGLGIYSGYRSPERQAQLYQEALRKYGSPQAARRWVAPPGRSNHNHGKAVDISYNGRSLKHAPDNVRKWVHENAKKYGLHFPMAHEPWHIEPLGTRGTAAPEQSDTVAARTNTVSYRAALPSYDEIEKYLGGIPDEDVRDLTRKRIYAQIEAQNKVVEQQEKAAKAELWRYIDQGATPDDVPFEVRQMAGMSAVSAAWGYIDTAAKGRAIESDETLLYDMQRYAATNPVEFAQIDLNDYRDRLSKEDVRKLSDVQNSALTDQRKAREDGVSLTTAFSQASTMLESVGLTTTGKDGTAREEAAKRIARFQNMLAQELEAFKQANDGRNPNQMEIQSMINRMLLPVVIKSERSMWNPLKTPWSSHSETEGFLFEAPFRPDDATVDVRVEYEDIPADMRRIIEADLETELMRKPSREEIAQRYEEFLLSR